jgi:CubicO group peptidase (beta-lactamase class C family)
MMATQVEVNTNVKESSALTQGRQSLDRSVWYNGSLMTAHGRRLTSRMLAVIATAAALALLATGCGGSPDGPKPAEESARVDQAMTYIRQHNQDIASEAGNQGESRPPIPYLLVGARDSKGYRGFVSSEPGIEIGSGVANVGSSTKSFTAALILQLDQEGKLSIDDTLADPRWNNVLQWPNGQNITLRMVLAHTAGIPDYEDSTAFVTHRLDPNWDPTPQDVIGFARVLPPYFAPGTGWHYSNTGFRSLDW